MTTDTLIKDKVLYTARTHVVGGREGSGRSDDGFQHWTLPDGPALYVGNG